MEIWQAFVLGLVQGFSEFLPISSSGHLILLQHWFGITDNVMFYSIMLHIGTLIPVIIVLWKQILGMFKRPFSKFWLWVLATVPAGIVGLILQFVVDLDAVFTSNLWLLSITFVLTGVELLWSEFRAKKVEMLNGINVKTATTMGIGQAFGVVPGLSRSGTTVTFGNIAKVNREDNANFTFIMSIPIIVLAAGVECFNVIKKGTIGDVNVWALLVGVATSAICGYIAIKFMLKLIKKANYKWFSLYLGAIAIVTLISALGVF